MAFSRLALAKHRLERSFKALEDAELLMKSGTIESAIATALRAGKEAAEAGLLAAGNEDVRRESPLFLCKQLLQDGKLTIDSFKAFRTIMDLNMFVNECDFSAVKRSEAAAALENLKYFIREMGNLLKR